MSTKKHIPFVFYADDFTGATDELEVLTKSGASSILFVEPPTKKQLAGLRNIDAVGIASNNRALGFAKLKQKLKIDFALIHNNISSSFIHYKICSTFDSSPQIGSIGIALDEGIKQFKASFVPIIGGHPSLGRYCVFGNLFAKVGTGTQSKVYRIDRHPSMKNHPTTPALESDLIKMLGKQTKANIQLIDWTIINKGKFEIELYLQKKVSASNVVLFDAQTINHIHHIGVGINYYATVNSLQTFAIGPSSVAEALGYAMNQRKNWIANKEWSVVKKLNSTIVFSGSCSVVTQQQIAFALQNGFEELIIKASEKNINKIVDQLLFFKNNSKSVIVHSGKPNFNKINPKTLGNLFGKIALGLLQATKVKRIVFAGGDTSSFAAKAMGVNALQFKQPYVQGAPICKVVHSSKLLNNMELNFKGGQVGEPNYFMNI